MNPPRPLTGEPLALDLLNTYWLDAEGEYDLLTSREETQAWLDELKLEPAERVSKETLENLKTTREAIRQFLEHGTTRGHAEAVTKVLSKGQIIESLGNLGPEVSYKIDKGWVTAWQAAHNLLELLRLDPRRIKKCAHPDCVLYFYDTSPKNARRWHDMATCGNRAKRSRHYQRTKGTTSTT
jgi:predicted RNA-binding Zn ribbon-like protein